MHLAGFAPEALAGGPRVGGNGPCPHTPPGLGKTNTKFIPNPISPPGVHSLAVAREGASDRTKEADPECQSPGNADQPLGIVGSVTSWDNHELCPDPVPPCCVG